MRTWSLLGPRCALAVTAAALPLGGRCLRPAEDAKAGRAAGVDALDYARTFSAEGLYNNTANDLWNDLQEKVVNASRSSILRAREYRALLENFSGEMATFVRGQTVFSNTVRATQEQRMKEIQKILGGGMHNASNQPYPDVNFTDSGSETKGVKFAVGNGSETEGRSDAVSTNLESSEMAKDIDRAELQDESKGTVESDATTPELVDAARELEVGSKGTSDTSEFVSTSPESLDARRGVPQVREKQFQDDSEGNLGSVSTTSLPEGALEMTLDDDLPQGTAVLASTSSPPAAVSNEDLDEPSGTAALASTSSPAAAVSNEDLDEPPGARKSVNATSQRSVEKGGALGLPSTTPQGKTSTTEDLDDIPQGAAPMSTTAAGADSTKKEVDADSRGVSDRAENAEVFAEVRCAFQKKALQCEEEGSRIRVLGAFWNRRVYKACKGTRPEGPTVAPAVTCIPNATTEVASQCDGQENCVLPAESACPESPFKAMRVSFKCI